jgi:membrane protein YqaA with SNARE-associated domain
MAATVLVMRRRGKESPAPPCRLAASTLCAWRMDTSDDAPTIDGRVTPAVQASTATERSSMLRRLYDWTINLSASPNAPWALATVSFVESSFFPIPPDALLIPMCLAQRRRCWIYALSCTIASVLGGFLGYAIGYFLMESLGAWIVSAYGYGEKIEVFQQSYQEWGLWIILIKGLTPIPYKLVTIASGAADFNLLVFALASIATRGARFFLIAGLLWKFGPPIRDFIEKRLTLITWAFLILLVGGFVIAKYAI